MPGPGVSLIERARIRITGDHHAEKATVRELAKTRNQPKQMTQAEVKAALGED